MTMNSKLNLILLLLVCTFFGCKKENTFSDFQYADKELVLTCPNINSKLFHEALYAFEHDLVEFYSKDKKDLAQAYSQFIRLGISGRANYKEMTSAHTLKVFEALKNETDLWQLNNSKSILNYNNPITGCIATNIQNKALKTTFNALISTNSMSLKLFGPPLMSNYRTAIQDKYLATYIALDLFYANLFNVDFSTIPTEEKVDFNKKPQ